MRIPDIVSTLRDCNMLTEDDHHSYSSMPGSPAGGKGGNKGRGRPRGANNLLRRNSSMRKSSAHPSGSGSGDGKEDGSLELMIPPPGSYFIHWDRVEVTLALEEHAKKGLLTLKPEKLKWSPYLLARGQLMLKTDTAPEQPIAPSEFPSHFSTHEVSALVKQKHSPGEDKQDTHTFIQYEPAMDISAVDQVAISGHAEAGPSRVSPSPGFVKNSETRSPTRSITPLVRIDPAEDQDRDSNFEPDEDEEDFQETPTRPRSRAAQQQKQQHQPSRVSARQLSSRQNSLVSESRSSANGRRTRASDRVQQKQKRGADQIDGLGNSSGEDEDGEGEEETEHDDTSPTMVNGTSPGRSNGGRVTRQNSSASLRPPPRKRNRVVSSPESSLLSEPPSSHTRISDMSSEDDTERDKTTSRALSTARRRGRPPLANGRRASVLSPEADRNVLSPPSATSRRTRSRPDGDAPAASPSISPSRRNSRRNGSAELSISHAPASSKHFKPPLDDPEAAVRNAKKARLNQALSAGVVISPTTSAARQPKTKTNGTTNGVSPEPEPREKIPSLETFMRDADSKGRVHDDDEDDLLDADAEGEVEEVLISLQAPSDGDVSAPYTPGVELDGDDADAEGELDDMDADAEGEVEEMDLDQ
ncbi:hypothetical protein DL93DRAFT_1310171 [Clavulina sp. PMI_390]|nr:hypothetical protein DL93DRAFT_1310171 [Clavulina sp. PMI_390]